MKSHIILFAILILITSAISKKICPKNDLLKLPITAYLKTGETVSGKGCIKGYGYGKCALNEINLNDRTIFQDETDSITVHFVKGYSDSCGWLFKVIDGDISAYVYNLHKWLKIFLFPINSINEDLFEINHKNLVKYKTSYLTVALNKDYWKYLELLSSDIAYVEKAGEKYDFTNQNISILVRDDLISWFYTQNMLSEFYKQPLLAILNYNYDHVNDQPYIYKLYKARNAAKRGTAQHDSINTELKRAFITYDRFNSKSKNSLGLDNVKVYFKDNNTIVGNARVQFNSITKEDLPLSLIPEKSIFRETINIDGKKKRLTDYTGSIIKLIVDGILLNAADTDSILINGISAISKNDKWVFKKEKIVNKKKQSEHVRGQSK